MSAIFEFSSGILIIVIGLAMTHLLAGLGSIIRYRKNLQIDWVNRSGFTGGSNS